MPDYQLIELSSDPFDARSLAGADSVGLDTEFMRERTFFAELCLVQLALPGNIVCIDPLGDVDNAVADCFWDALCDVEWVVHSARQDIEVISQASGRMPRAIFDTQVAAALLGFQPQIGYAGLVKTLFDVELDKSHTRCFSTLQRTFVSSCRRARS